MIVAFINPVPTLHSPEPTPESEGMAAGLSQLLRGAELIPVTGLDEAELLSVPAAFTSWQILQHGAVVLSPQGEEDVAWRRLVMETQRSAQQALELAHQAALHITQLGQLGLDVELRERHGRPLFVLMGHPHDLDLTLDQAERAIREWLADSPLEPELRVLRQGRHLTVLPRGLTPAGAVNYVMGLLEERPELILGVSAHDSDADMLALCDYALLPGSSARMGAPTDEDE